MSSFFADCEPEPRVLLVGLTGGIATGKSTVAGMFRELGIAVIDADAIVHDLLARGGEAVEPILRGFGRAVLASDGGIDRAALAEIVFTDAAARKRLEKVVHPLVHETSARRIRDLALSGGAEIILYDAALLIEAGRHTQFHRLIVVFTRPEVQLERLMTRDRLTVDQAGARIRAQMPLEAKLELADYVIDNSDHWQETRRQVAEIDGLLRQDARLMRDGRRLPSRRAARGAE